MLVRVFFVVLSGLVACGDSPPPPVAEDPGAGSFMTASDGVRLHYFDVGEGSPVVLIHGYTANAEDKWFSTGVAPALSARHRVVAIDCRGHGRSDKPHDPMKYGPQMADDVVELMDHLAIERAHLHGYSMGGGIVTQLLVRYPDRNGQGTGGEGRESAGRR